MTLKFRSTILLLLLSTLLLASCSKKAVYIDETFSSDSPFKLRVDGDISLACESARRSLLGQGYLIDLANSEEVKARKATRGENTFIEMNVVCVPEINGTTIFATGVLSTYDLKKSSSSASVGLSALGSISLPIGQSADSLVKVSEETIDDKDFYKRFFTAVDTLLGELKAGKVSEEPVEEPVAEPAATESAPPLTQPAIWPELFPEPAEPEAVSGSLPDQPEPQVVAPAPQPVPSEPAPVSVPLPLPSEPVPVTEPEPVQPASPSLTEPAVMHTAPETSSEPATAAEPSGIPPAPAPAEVLSESHSGAASSAQTVGASPADSTATGSVPRSAESELAPIQTTAVKKAVPAVIEAPQEAPDAESKDFQAERIEDLF